MAYHPSVWSRSIFYFHLVCVMRVISSLHKTTPAKTHMLFGCDLVYICNLQVYLFSLKISTSISLYNLLLLQKKKIGNVENQFMQTELLLTHTSNLCILYIEYVAWQDCVIMIRIYHWGILAAFCIHLYGRRSFRASVNNFHLSIEEK